MADDIIAEDSFSSDEDFESETDSESSEDVDQKVAQDNIFDTEFFKCYSALKKKDDKIYDKDTRFFAEEEKVDEKTDEPPPTIDISTKPRARPRMTLLDHEVANAHTEEIIPKSYYEQELSDIKRDIVQISNSLDSDDDLFVAKNSTRSNPEKSNSKTPKDEELGSLWNDNEELTEEDKFLRDYILNKRYLSKPEDNKKIKSSFFSENIDDLSDVEDDREKEQDVKKELVESQSNKKILRIPRNSTTTIRDLVEKREKKDKRLKKLTKEKKKKKVLKDEDCEDIVGDLKTKFHYSETEPQDFGLTAQELLIATDEEVDKWMKVQKEIESDENPSGKREELKRKIFASIYAESDQGDETMTEQPPVKKHKKRRKKNKVVKTDVAPDRLLSYGLSKTKLKKSHLL